MWYELGGAVQRLSGTSGTPVIPKGSVILNLQALPAGGGGSITGFPDGKAGSLTITLADGSNGFNYDPKHTNCTTTSDNQIAFVGTSEYFVEFMMRSGASVV